MKTSLVVLVSTIGLTSLFLYSLSMFVNPEPDGTLCRAQVVDWVRDGGRCTFIPVTTVLSGQLKDGVCLTAEIGGEE